MKPGNKNSFKALKSININDRIYKYYSINEAEKNGKVLTGLLYINPEVKDHVEILNITDKPLNQFTDNELCPGSAKLVKINASLN